MLERLGPQAVFLGDNGGRAALAGVPSLIRRSEQRGFRVLPGSDPLPIACDHERVGAFGFLAEARLTEHAPWHTLREWLMQRSTSPMRYGRACSSLQLCWQPGPAAAEPEARATVHGVTRDRRAIIAMTSGRQSDTGDPALAGSAVAAPDIETSSADYASRFRGPAGRYLLDVQARSVASALEGLPPGRALDVGGGHGQLVQPLKALGWQVTVQGSSPECERNLRELHGVRDCEFLQGNLFELPVADRSFDLVIAVRLLSHVEDWPGLLAEMCRVAHRAVVVDYPSSTGLNALTPLLFGLKRSLDATYCSGVTVVCRALGR